MNLTDHFISVLVILVNKTIKILLHQLPYALSMDSPLNDSVLTLTTGIHVKLSLWNEEENASVPTHRSVYCRVKDGRVYTVHCTRFLFNFRKNKKKKVPVISGVLSRRTTHLTRVSHSAKLTFPETSPIRQTLHSAFFRRKFKRKTGDFLSPPLLLTFVVLVSYAGNSQVNRTL